MSTLNATFPRGAPWGAGAAVVPGTIRAAGSPAAAAPVSVPTAVGTLPGAPCPAAGLPAAAPDAAAEGWAGLLAAGPQPPMSATTSVRARARLDIMTSPSKRFCATRGRARLGDAASVYRRAAGPKPPRAPWTRTWKRPRERHFGEHRTGRSAGTSHIGGQADRWFSPTPRTGSRRGPTRRCGRDPGPR